ncbi:hypothetical protein [Rhodococcus daqingensis]|uniref:Uncharacterized protein n=1 Tax=Rhodococcus daqingensis TaxID=2479363 RepID=A0ABW2RUL9_9NOCA
MTAATAALVVGGFVTGTGSAVAADTGSAATGSTSSGSSGVDPTLSRSATITHGNLSITRAIVGNNVGVAGDTVTYRTTFSATDGPARQVTRIYEAVNTSYGRPPMGFKEANVTYTDPSGSVVTEKVPYAPDGAVGAWPVDAATGTTVVYESTYRFKDPSLGFAIGYDSYWPTENIDNWVSIDATGLDTLKWSPTGVTVTCLYGCSSYLSLPAMANNFGSSN